MASVSSISGLASGIQWSDMIDQIMQNESARQLTPVSDKATATQSKADAWSGYRTTLQAFRDASKTLGDGTSFDKFAVNASTSPSSGLSLVTATAGTGAAPGSYQVEVVSTASAEKLGSGSIADVTSAMNLSGSFVIGGRQVSIDATDSLSAIRDKINAMNTGSNASHVSATILTVASGVNRLILTNENTGSAGIELTENGGSNVLSGLGLVSSNLVANTAPDGSARSFGMTTVTSTIAQALGVPMPSPSTFKVNGVIISVDLSQDSIASIVAKINAASSNSAKVQSETVNGTTVSRIVVNGSVTVDSADAANSTQTLQQLGFLQNARGGERQTLRAAGALTDSSTSSPATASSLLTNLGSAIGDTLSFAGTRTDGTSVSVGVTVDASTTMQDVLDALSANGTGFGVAGHGVTASIDAQGRLQLADSAVGESKLSFTATNDAAGGGTLDFGMTSVAVAGRSMQLARPSDAQLRVDGVLVSRSTNTISDALAGVTLSLQHAEVGTMIDVNVARDTDAVVNALKALASAFNAASAYVSAKTAANGPLAFDSSIRSTITNLRSSLLGGVAGLGNSTYTTASMVGLSLDKNGQLNVDAEALKKALAFRPNEVKALFQTSGSAALGTVQYMSASGNTKPGTYNVSITSPATTPVASSTTLGGAYGAASTANQMVVTDSFSGNATTIALADGDTAASIVSKLNTAFGANNLKLSASVDGGSVKITGANYGSGSSITIGFKLDGVDAGQQLGFAGTTAGTDVVGTINGKAATGAGQLLTADAPAVGDTNDAQGLALLYTGSIAADTTISYVKGLGGALMSSADAVLTSGTGVIDVTTNALRLSIDGLTSKQTDIQARLDRQRATLTAQFTAMETAMSRLQSQGQWLTGQINALSSLNSGK